MKNVRLLISHRSFITVKTKYLSFTTLSTETLYECISNVYHFYLLEKRDSSRIPNTQVCLRKPVNSSTTQNNNFLPFWKDCIIRGVIKTLPKNLRWSILQEQSKAKSHSLFSQDVPPQMFYRTLNMPPIEHLK